MQARARVRSRRASRRGPFSPDSSRLSSLSFWYARDARGHFPGCGRDGFLGLFHLLQEGGIVPGGAVVDRGYVGS